MSKGPTTGHSLVLGCGTLAPFIHRHNRMPDWQLGDDMAVDGEAQRGMDIWYTLRLGRWDKTRMRRCAKFWVTCEGDHSDKNCL